MKNGLLLIVLIAPVLFMAASVSANAAMNLTVSPKGNDAWSGKRAEPNKAQSDGPFATLERARDAIRALKKAGKMPEGGVTINLRGEVISRTYTFELTQDDSGTPESPILYRAYKNETVRIIGGKEVTGWKPVTDPEILSRLDESARDKVMQVDLKAQGITEFGKMQGRGFGRPIVPAGLELFFQDKPMTLSRWPNTDWTTMAGVPAGQQGGKFTYTGDRPKRWKSLDDVWVHGYWTYDWADTYEKIAALNPDTREVTTVAPHGVYGYTSGKRFIFLNVLEELDSPSEWYLDRSSGILYFWPPAPLDSSRTIVSLLETPLVQLKGASYVTFQGLTFEASRGSGVVIEGGKQNLVAGCTLRNLGTFGVSIGSNSGDYQSATYNDTTLNRRAGSNNGVVSCDIYETGDGAILLGGGDRKTLTPGGNFAENNHLHHYCRWSLTYRPGVAVDGVGNRVAHNRIHDAPHNAILLGGNEHLIEYNDISRVCLETGDAGAFYMGRDFTMRGNIVRYNAFRDIRRALAGGGGFVDVMAVYLDDCASGTTVFGNLFVRAGRAAMIGGGRDNTIENNIFIECTPSVHVDARGTGWAKFWFDGNDLTLMDRLKAVQHDQPPYSTRYPHLANILNDTPATAKYNRIDRNIRVGGQWIEWLDGMNEKTVEVKDNLTEGDPGFVAPEKGDYRLKPNSPARKLGFQPIPFNKIGLQKDRYRTVLPGP